MNVITTFLAGIAVLLYIAFALVLSALPLAFAFVIAVWVLRSCS